MDLERRVGLRRRFTGSDTASGELTFASESFVRFTEANQKLSRLRVAGHVVLAHNPAKQGATR
jgi:hypothetical protein